MSVATKRGDDGLTDIQGGRRVAKFSARVAASGCVDELNAYLGIIQTQQLTSTLPPILDRIQSDLFVLGSDLSSPCIGAMTKGRVAIGPDHVKKLEEDLERLENDIPPITTFIIPAGSPPASHLHFARTICRRAERKIALLASEEDIGSYILPYINRLSDLIFIMARWLNHHRGISDRSWVVPESSK